MFSLLTPISLWLGAMLAVPLVIHFLGRQRLRRQPFPSLLLLEEKFSKSMHRHRLKNLLLLILRTLLILCLLLALANPALEMKSGRAAGAAGAETAAVLVHNGAYGMLPAGGEGGAADALDRQRRRIRLLDSAAGGRVRTVPLIADGPGLSESAARFGDYGEAAGRLLAALDPRDPAAQAYLPVFAWEDLEPARKILDQAMKDRPGLQLVLWDFGAAGASLSAFSGVRALPSSKAPTVALRAPINPLAAEGSAFKVRTYLETRVFQEAQPGGGLAEVTLPLSEGARTAGRLAFEGGGGGEGGGLFAVRDWHFSFPNPGRLLLAHAGSTLASLPSLGRENYFRRIVHVSSVKDLPWPSEAAGAAGEGMAGGGGGGGGKGAEAGSLRLVYLSNERNTDPAAYGRLVEFVKRGGRLIVGVGRESDVPLINRFLLQPLRMGRLGAVSEGGASAGAGAENRAEVDARALASALSGSPAPDGPGALPAGPGTLGMVRKRFAFAPDTGTAILIRQGGEPVLAERDFHRGKVLLWTTDIDDLEWSDLGVAPLVPLLHQAFQEGAGGLTANRAVASDSTFQFSLPDPGLKAEVRDPDGRPFTRMRADGGRVRLGPFDKLGLHRAAWGKDTLVFAVNLASRGPALFREADDWDAWNLERKAAFMKAFEPYRGRVIVAPPEDGDGVRAAVRPLWKAFFLAAILLLFLEGLIASAYSLGRPSRERKPG